MYYQFEWLISGNGDEFMCLGAMISKGCSGKAKYEYGGAQKAL